MALDTKQSEIGGAGFGSIKLGRMGWSLVSLLALLALWQLVSLFVDPRHLPGPLIVLERIYTEFLSGELVYHVSATLGRVAAAFVIAMFIGSAIGIAMGRAPTVDKFFDSWLIFFLNLPALVSIILCFVWFGLTEVAAVLAVTINKIPNVAVTVREGARSLSRDLNEMAHVYRFSWWKTLRHVTLPQLAPFLSAASRTGLSLVWKIVLVVELLGRSNGVGYQLQIAFQEYDVAQILAYAVAFIAVVQVIEFGILQPIDQRVNRWRR